MHEEKICIFVLEDSLTDLARVKIHIDSLGLGMVTTDTIEEIHLAKGCSVAILDLMVVGSSGCDTVATFRQMWPLMPIVVHTVSDQPCQCSPEGADFFVSKNSGPKELVMALIKAVDTRRAILATHASELSKTELIDEIDLQLAHCSEELKVVAEAAEELC